MRNLLQLLKSKNDASICWYPSAGMDFRELLFLSENYVKANQLDMTVPDLFILTDVNPDTMNFGNPFDKSAFTDLQALKNGRIGDVHWLYHSRKTKIKVKAIEEIQCPVFGDYENFTNLHAIHRAYFMHVHVHSGRYGEWDTQMIYLMVENTRFALDFLVKEKIHVDTVVIVRYGEGFGGSLLGPQWILGILPDLGSRYLLTHRAYVCNTQNPLPINEKLYEEYPWMHKKMTPELEPPFYTVRAEQWSDYDPVLWMKVK